MPKSRDGPETRVCEVCAFSTFFKRPSEFRAVACFLKGAVERPPR
jgi:hypothetical protein